MIAIKKVLEKIENAGFDDMGLWSKLTAVAGSSVMMLRFLFSWKGWLKVLSFCFTRQLSARQVRLSSHRC